MGKKSWNCHQSWHFTGFAHAICWLRKSHFAATFSVLFIHYPKYLVISINLVHVLNLLNNLEILAKSVLIYLSYKIIKI